MVTPDLHHGSELRCQPLSCAQDFVGIWPSLIQLRHALGCERDGLSDPLHFLASTDSGRRSSSVACWNKNELIGVLFATSSYVCGIPTGYAVSGDYAGRGSLLCRPEHQSMVIAAATRFLLAGRVHSLHLRVIPAQAPPLTLEPLNVKQFAGSVPGDSTALTGTYDDFLATLGRHTRRNVRYYTRRAVAAGISFDPNIGEAEYDESVRRLNRGVSFPIRPRHFERDRRLLTLHQSSRFALRNAAGEIVAVLCGFTSGGCFHLLTQLNDASLASFSLSLVLRGFTINHLIATGHSELQFVGGSSLSLGRFCPQVRYRSFFLDRRDGFAAMAKSAAGFCVRWLDSHHVHVSPLVEPVCGGWLSDARLVSRTALAPAAMVTQAALARSLSDRPQQTPLPLPDNI